MPGQISYLELTVLRLQWPTELYNYSSDQFNVCLKRAASTDEVQSKSVLVTSSFHSINLVTVTCSVLGNLGFLSGPLATINIGWFDHRV